MPAGSPADGGRCVLVGERDRNAGGSCCDSLCHTQPKLDAESHHSAEGDHRFCHILLRLFQICIIVISEVMAI